jgi:hypothetical protein
VALSTDSRVKFSLRTANRTTPGTPARTQPRQRQVLDERYSDSGRVRAIVMPRFGEDVQPPLTHGCVCGVSEEAAKGRALLREAVCKSAEARERVRRLADGRGEPAVLQAQAVPRGRAWHGLLGVRGYVPACPFLGQVAAPAFTIKGQVSRGRCGGRYEERPPPRVIPPSPYVRVTPSHPCRRGLAHPAREEAERLDLVAGGAWQGGRVSRPAERDAGRWPAAGATSRVALRRQPAVCARIARPEQVVVRVAGEDHVSHSLRA